MITTDLCPDNFEYHHRIPVSPYPRTPLPSKAYILTFDLDIADLPHPGSTGILRARVECGRGSLETGVMKEAEQRDQIPDSWSSVYAEAGRGSQHWGASWRYLQSWRLRVFILNSLQEFILNSAGLYHC
jgi:hypothetical protein